MKSLDIFLALSVNPIVFMFSRWRRVASPFLRRGVRPASSALFAPKSKRSSHWTLGSEKNATIRAPFSWLFLSLALAPSLLSTSTSGMAFFALRLFVFIFLASSYFQL